MGLFRLLLAIAVLLQHVNGCEYAMTGGATSVQTFYIISGFFIAMILDTKYSRPDQLWVFYSNRALRIYSTYWLFLVAAILMQFAAHLAVHRSLFDLWSQNSQRLGEIGPWYLALTNLFIFGQDLALFLAIGNHGLHWTTSFWQSSPIVPVFMLIAPAWSLSLELSFYLIAPWLLRKRVRWVIALIVLSLTIRLVLWHMGLRADPWSYRFFPNELGLFLLGALSYRLIYRLYRNQIPSFRSKLFAFGIFPAVALFPLYDHSHGMFFSTTKLMYLGYVVFALPMLFRWTGAISLDRHLGELSYPLYLCHFSIVQMLNYYSFRLGVLSRAALAIVLSCGVAYLSVIALERPIDRFRQSRLRRSARFRKDSAPNPAHSLPVAEGARETIGESGNGGIQDPATNGELA